MRQKQRLSQLAPDVQKWRRRRRFLDAVQHHRAAYWYTVDKDVMAIGILFDFGGSWIERTINDKRDGTLKRTSTPYSCKDDLPQWQRPTIDTIRAALDSYGLQAESADHLEGVWEHAHGAARLMRSEGRKNLKRVRTYLEKHPGARQVEVAEALGLSTMAINRHFKTIRNEWKTARHK